MTVAAKLSQLTGLGFRTANLLAIGSIAGHCWKGKFGNFMKPSNAGAVATQYPVPRQGYSAMVNARNDGDVVDLTDSPPASRDQGMVRIEEEDEDEDFKLAIALSLQQHNEVGKHGSVTGRAASVDAEPGFSCEVNLAEKVPDEQKNGLGTWLGLDRKTMEAERLARLKRKRDEEEIKAPLKMKSVSLRKERPVSPPPLRRGFQNAMAPDRSTMNHTSASKGQGYTTLHSSTPQLYPEGAVLKTYAPGYTTARTISFNDLIAPVDSLRSCLLSSFIWDFDWLFPHFKTTSTNFLLVMHAKHPEERQRVESDFVGIPNLKTCFPPMEGQVNCMHSKLILLFWNERCRLAVPTANLMGFDWGVGSVMENMVWLIDLPKVEAGQVGKETRFKRSLKTFLTAQTVPSIVMTKLDLYDFGKTEDIGLVHSIGGAHLGDAWKETGHCGFGKTVKDMGLVSDEPIEVDFVASSVGKLNDEFMRCMYLAAQGDEGLTELTLRTAKAFPASRVGEDTQKKSLGARPTGNAWTDRFRFYFPSQQVIRASNGGERSAGTICFSERWWEGNFPKRAMRDCVSVREGLLMHNKILFVRFSQSLKRGAGRCIGYAYVGSANLSESAWGRLVLDRATKRPKLNCRNWEIGVLIPVPASEANGLGNNHRQIPDARQSLDALSGTIPLPMRTPGDNYESSGRKPWFFENS